MRSVTEEYYLSCLSGSRSLLGNNLETVPQYSSEIATISHVYKKQVVARLMIGRHDHSLQYFVAEAFEM